ncbi:MAG: MAPEG family protein, partial [Hyphomonadaceae bacterium]|nr:MAPEG family protein [Hyphomonadaceae bacterium]
MYDHGMIAPVVALVIWSLLMLIWLYATRIPAMAAAKLKPGQATKAQMEALPVANVASNY